MTEPTGIPKYEAQEFSPKKNRYCLAVFVINEGDRIRRQLEKCRTIAGGVDIIIADGGSTDGSLDPDFLKSCGVSALLTKGEAGKLGTQMRMAMHFALERGYDGLIAMDGNDKDDPKEVTRFIEALEKGADHVQGSRYIPGGLAENTPVSRALGIRLLHAPLISLAAGFRYTDTTNGFRGYSRRLLEHPGIDLFRPVFTSYELHYYLAIRAARLGLKICEVPVSRRYPGQGKTPTKISPLKGNLTVLATLFRAARGHYDPKTAREGQA